MESLSSMNIFRVDSTSESYDNIDNLIRCAQCNLHHCKEANGLFNDWMTSNDKTGNTKIGFLQEPYTYENNIAFFDKNLNIFAHTGRKKTRAAIVASKNLPFWLLNQFTNEDVVSVALRSDNKIYVFCSVYMDFNENNPPPDLLKNLSLHCFRNSWGLFIGTDANAHHTLWGSSDVNSRGQILSDFIFSSDLHICNIGNTPTFADCRREEVLDITLVNTSCLHRISDWRVSERVSGSDHFIIDFNINLKVEKMTEYYRNIRKCDWEGYKRDLSNNVKHINLGTDIDTLACNLEHSIIDAYYNNCRLRKSFGSTKPKWWSGELKNLKSIWKNSVKKHGKNKTPENKERMVKAKDEYKKSKEKAREKGWQSFCTELDDLTTTAKIQKIMKLGKKQPIGTIKREDGTFTNTPSETLETLLGVHFPQNEQNANPINEDFDLLSPKLRNC